MNYSAEQLVGTRLIAVNIENLVVFVTEILSRFQSFVLSL